MSNLHPIFQTILNTIPGVPPMYTDQVLTGVHPKGDAKLESAFAAETARQQADADALIDTFGIGAGTEPAQPFRSMHADEDVRPDPFDGGCVEDCCKHPPTMRQLTAQPIVSIAGVKAYILHLAVYVENAAKELPRLTDDGSEAAAAVTVDLLRRITDASWLLGRVADGVVGVPMEPLDAEGDAEARAEAKRAYLEQLRKGA